MKSQGMTSVIKALSEGSLMPVQKFMTMQPAVVETFHSGAHM